MMQEIFCHKSYFDSADVEFMIRSVAKHSPGEDIVLDYGTFPNCKIANIGLLKNDLEFVNWMIKKLQPAFDLDIVLNSMTNVLLFKPWDIHSDFFLDTCAPGDRPYYNCLIPLEDAPSRTIIFDQKTSGANDFYIYKAHNHPVSTPIDEQFWNDNLDFCWPVDRQYLTVKQILPYQRTGQLNAFPRQYFHSSDNFHHRMDKPKHFIQVRIDTKNV